MLAAILWAVLLAAAPAPPAAAVPATPSPATVLPAPIGHMLRDAAGRPSAAGQTVVVAGRASVASGRLGTGSASFFVQDHTAGVRVDARSGPFVVRGDSVVAVGRLAFRNGLAVVEGARVRVVAAPRRVPAPLAYDSKDPERVEGRLVAVEATVAGLNPVPAGDALLLSLPDGTLLVAFVFKGRDEPIPLGAYAPGDRIRIVGVAGQYDREAPFRDSYQIYPRRPDDVSRVGLSAAAYRRGSLVALGLLALALLWAAVLRRQVARRVTDLQTSEERYRVLVERASDAIAVHDLTGTNVEINAAGRCVVGIGPDAEVPPLSAVVDPADREALRMHLATLVDLGHARTDLRIRRPDGTSSVFEFDSQTVRLDGHLRALSLARDVEARRAYERGLVAAREAAEEALRVKSAFLASMSHEIRTPLTAVLGYAEILAEEVGDDQRDLVASIESGGRRLLGTLNSVLDLARLDAGRETLRPERLDLAAHVRQSVALLDGLAARKGLRLDCVLEVPALPACLDTGALDRVLTNLVGNAIKFTDSGAVTVNLSNEGDQAVLVVSDTGVGMSEAFLPDVFGEFRQESEGHARRHEGSGLGLPITKRLVELMGGTIRIASAAGRGTTVTVTFPLGAEAPAEALLSAREHLVAAAV